MNIYVGNLPYSTDRDALRASFEAHGTVDRATVVMDRDSGRSKGFGFVEMPNDAEAKSAIEALDGSEMDGRNIKVNQARPREDNRR
jgi:RNA recognition motif-containing protein